MTSKSPPTGRRTGPRLISVLYVLVPLAALAIGLAVVATQLRPRPATVTAEAPRVPAPTSSTPAPTATKQAPAAQPAPTQPATAQPAAAETAAVDVAAVVPATPWRVVPPTTELTRIGVGSCLHQGFPQPIWTPILAAAPQLFLMLGDNVYGDVKGPQMTELVGAYARQLAHPEFKVARAALPMLGVWDDHDYGLNDAGVDFTHKAAAERLFRAYWRIDDKTGLDTGIAYARTFGPPGRRVQVLMLDTRSFRSGLTRKSESFPHWGKYEPNPAADSTVLGEAQWAWLVARLREPAEVRLIASSIQVLAEGHGFERWGNLPAERERLVKLIETSGAGGVVLLSGDRHMGALYRAALGTGRPLPEMTASSLNRSYGPSKDARLPPLVGGLHHQENYGLIDIDWTGRSLTLRLAGMDGRDFETMQLSFDDLGIKP